MKLIALYLYDRWPIALKGVGAAVGGFVFHHQIVFWLLCAMVADVATGLLAGFYQKKLDSDISMRGMCKKAMMLILVAVGEVLTRAAQASPAISVVGSIQWAPLIAGGFFIHELISIAENAGRVGLWLPKPLADALKKLQAETNGTPDVPAQG